MLSYKLNEDKTAILVNDQGFPIVIDSDKEEEDPDREFGLDAVHLFSKVPDLSNTNKQLKEKNEEFKELLKPLKAVKNIPEWFTKAFEALKTVKNLEDKKLIDAGEVEAIKRQAEEAFQEKFGIQAEEYKEKIKELEKTVGSRDAEIYRLLVSEHFNTSKYVKEKLAMLPKVAFSHFGPNFRVEKDEESKTYDVIAYYPYGPKKGEKIYSKAQVGEIAPPDEALQILVEMDPDKDSLLRGTEAAGGGAGGSGGGAGGATTENPFKKGEGFNLTEQGRLMREKPELAKRLAREAGVKLPE